MLDVIAAEYYGSIEHLQMHETGNFTEALELDAS
jgi:hypothetical protein